ncbi:hypothetical protein [Geobacter sp. SVR]|uniref:hypothetical protein n=1 Tax=Geobacter sp. SVR TaxID=2495594 RepID=UPI00143EFC8A|nr:hypothetical protein [Geobacter sp. SVR]BCS55184.1 hypothetical protein GSVR_34920 [Geobacter sp. SVR]GCF85365.1 hypothetical protein GSbR_19650 [Geobacter sp. SVR]
MKGKSYKVENRETAFTVWRECSGNIELTLRTLRDQHGLSLTKPTLYDWKEKFGWENRAARADAVSQEVADNAADNLMLKALLDQKKKYEQYFETLGPTGIDTQATYAFNSLIKTICDIQNRQAAGVGFDRPKFFLENLQWLVGWMKKNDPEGLPLLARHIDKLTADYKMELMNGNA